MTLYIETQVDLQQYASSAANSPKQDMQSTQKAATTTDIINNGGGSSSPAISAKSGTVNRAVETRTSSGTNLFSSPCAGSTESGRSGGSFASPPGFAGHGVHHHRIPSSPAALQQEMDVEARASSSHRQVSLAPVNPAVGSMAHGSSALQEGAEDDTDSAMHAAVASTLRLEQDHQQVCGQLLQHYLHVLLGCCIRAGMR